MCRAEQPLEAPASCLRAAIRESPQAGMTMFSLHLPESRSVHATDLKGIGVILEMNERAPEHITLQLRDAAQVHDGAAMNLRELFGVESTQQFLERSTNDVPTVRRNDLGVLIARLEVQDFCHREHPRRIAG